MTPFVDFNNHHLPNSNNDSWSSQDHPQSNEDSQIPAISATSAYLGHAQREHVPSRGVRGVKKQNNLQSATLPRKAKFREQQQPQSMVISNHYNLNHTSSS